jgi:hypothetical protein
LSGAAAQSMLSRIPVRVATAPDAVILITLAAAAGFLAIALASRRT